MERDFFLPALALSDKLPKGTEEQWIILSIW